MAHFETLKFEQSEEIVTVTLDRPKLNLFTTHMIEELILVWHSLRTNKSARCVILTAQGEHFSAGADLAEIGDKGFTPEDARIHQLAGHEMMRSLLKSDLLNSVMKQ